MIAARLGRAAQHVSCFMHFLADWTGTFFTLPPSPYYLCLCLTSFHGANNVSILGGNGLFPNCSVAAPPPFTMKSNHPSSLVMV